MMKTMMMMKKKTNQKQIKRREPSAVLPQMFGHMTPPPLNPIPYNGGYLKLIFEGMKLEEIKKMHCQQADIYDAMYRQTKSMADSFYITMTLGRRIELFHQEAHHRKVMMEQQQDEGRDVGKHRKIMMVHEETKGEAEALNAVYEARISEYEFRMREREYNRLLKADEEGREE
jgi:hypothetical protein